MQMTIYYQLTIAKSWTACYTDLAIARKHSYGVKRAQFLLRKSDSSNNDVLRVSPCTKQAGYTAVTISFVYLCPLPSRSRGDPSTPFSGLSIRDSVLGFIGDCHS
jgi:hypothetical protein